MTFHVPEKYRVKTGLMASDETFKNNGAFLFKINGVGFIAISSDQMGWEHVSVSNKKRCPTWEEMCHIKNMFWDENDCVVQYHPSQENYVNNHPYCLHLWRPTEQTLVVPPTYMVGKVEHI